MYTILFVLHDTELLDSILNAWDDAGVSGVTILASTGLKRFQDRVGLREDIPLIPSLDDLMERFQATNRTLFTIVNSEEMVDKVVAATESVTGDLDLPNTGILVVLPVARAYGLNRRDSEDR